MKEFFFVGPGKTGSSWLHQTLETHPDIMFGFPENLKSYFFHKSIGDIKNINSSFNFENPINNTKSLVYFNESTADTFYHTYIGHEIYSNIDHEKYHKNIIVFLKNIRPNIQIVITDRNRDENFHLSWYSQILKQGSCLLFEDFKIKVRKINEYDYKKNYIENFKTHILSYEDLKNDQNLYLAKVAKILEIDEKKFKAPNSKVNKRLSIKEMYLNYLLNIIYYKFLNTVFKNNINIYTKFLRWKRFGFGSKLIKFLPVPKFFYKKFLEKKNEF